MGEEVLFNEHIVLYCSTVLIGYLKLLKCLEQVKEVDLVVRVGLGVKVQQVGEEEQLLSPKFHLT